MVTRSTVTREMRDAVLVSESRQRDVGAARGRRGCGARGHRRRIPAGLAPAGARVRLRRARADRPEAQPARPRRDARRHAAAARAAPVLAGAGEAIRAGDRCGRSPSRRRSSGTPRASTRPRSRSSASIVVFASLEAAFGLCVGCRVFYLGMRHRARAAARVRGLRARARGALEILEVDEQLELASARRTSRP